MDFTLQSQSVSNDKSVICVILERKLNDCSLRHQKVNVHGNLNEFIFRYSIVPDTVDIDIEHIYCAEGMNEINILKINEIKYIEEDNSICLITPEMEIYFDFLDNREDIFSFCEVS